MKDKKEESESKEEKGGSMAKIVIIVVLSVVLAGGSAGAALYFSGIFSKNEEVATSETSGGNTTAPNAVRQRALYIPLDPPFVVNLDDNGTLRFMQINVSIMARRKEVIEEIGANTPRIKNDLLMLFARQKYSELALVDERERLRKEALQLVQDVMQEISGTRGVEELFFLPQPAGFSIRASVCRQPAAPGRYREGNGTPACSASR